MKGQCDTRPRDRRTQKKEPWKLWITLFIQVPWSFVKNNAVLMSLPYPIKEMELAVTKTMDRVQFLLWAFWDTSCLEVQSPI